MKLILQFNNSNKINKINNNKTLNIDINKTNIKEDNKRL